MTIPLTLAVTSDITSLSYVLIACFLRGEVRCFYKHLGFFIFYFTCMNKFIALFFFLLCFVYNNFIIINDDSLQWKTAAEISENDALRSVFFL